MWAGPASSVPHRKGMEEELSSAQFTLPPLITGPGDCKLGLANPLIS